MKCQRCGEDITAMYKQLLAEKAAMQAKIDELMLEYCPGEMTPEQLDEWAKHQRKSDLPTIK